MHPKLTEVKKNLSNARAVYAHACTQAKGAIKAVVGDGTGDPSDLADAQELAREFGFTLAIQEPLEVVAPKKAKK